MEITKKFILLGSIVATSLFGGTVTLLPYYAFLNFDTKSKGSFSYKGYIGGLYFSHKNSSHLFDFDIAYTQIKYKNPFIKDLKQTDITTTYSWFYPTHMYKVGLHHINTTDKDLGHGNTLILGYGKYKRIKGYNVSYGAEAYFSRYGLGYNDNWVRKAINVYQISPYFTFSRLLDKNSRNTINVKLNYVHSKEFHKKNYTSLELSDTYRHKKFHVSVKGYIGQMKAGVKDGGHTVYNTKDLYKYGYGVKVGYAPKKNLAYDVSYSRNYFIENGKTKKTSNDVTGAAFRYSY